MYPTDTIVAVATPAGRGGIGIVRLSGPRAADIAAIVFRSGADCGAAVSHHLRHGVVLDDDGELLVDEALAVVMRGPNSYTGEDVVELQCHGNPVLLRQVMARCCAAGARPAEAGEFTKRAFLNGRIDLVQAEAVADLIGARTEAAARASVRQLTGALSAQLAALREALIDVRARIEVLIDFSDEDVDVSSDEIVAGLERGAAQIDALLATFRRGRLLREGLHLAIIGRPNVGKSSLLNALLGSERAIVTPIPGTTRDLIEESVEIGGIAVVLSDTAGLREADEPVERIGVERARQRAAEADGVLLVLDRSKPLRGGDRELLSVPRPQPSVVVANKADLPPAWDLAALPAGLPAVAVSAATGTDLDALRARIAEVFGEAADAGGPVLTQVRHRDALAKSRTAIENALAGLRADYPVDVVAVDVQEAVESIGAITGVVTTDDVLDRIFREFCIGK